MERDRLNMTGRRHGIEGAEDDREEDVFDFIRLIDIILFSISIIMLNVTKLMFLCL